MILEIKTVDKSKIISQNLPSPPAHRVTTQMRIRYKSEQADFDADRFAGPV